MLFRAAYIHTAKTKTHRHGATVQVAASFFGGVQFFGAIVESLQEASGQGVVIGRRPCVAVVGRVVLDVRFLWRSHVVALQLRVGDTDRVLLFLMWRIEYFLCDRVKCFGTVARDCVWPHALCVGIVIGACFMSHGANSSLWAQTARGYGRATGRDSGLFMPFYSNVSGQSENCGHFAFFCL